MKKLIDYSWKVTEEEYRKYPCLHYSLLSDFTREGYKVLIDKEDVKESKSLLFGTVVDTLLTQNKEFDKLFYISSEKLDDKAFNVCGTLYEKTKAEDWKDIPENLYPEVYKYLPASYKDETKHTKIVNILKSKYKEYVNSKDKILVPYSTYEEALRCVQALTIKLMDKYWKNKEDYIKFNFQYKFKAILNNNIEYKAMFDCIIVDYKHKIIHPIDIKTSSFPEYEFGKSFIKWNYQYQARLYVRILKKVLENTEYSDFEIKPMTFLVVNKKSLNPMFFLFKDTFTLGDIKLGNTIGKDPEEIGLTIMNFINSKSTLPPGINEDDLNDLQQIIDQYEDKN